MAIGDLYLYFCTVYSSRTQSASHFAAQALARISRTNQFILQSLRDTLRWGSLVGSLFITCILVFGLVGFAHATPKCSAIAEGSAAYTRASELVSQLSEFRTWSSSHSFPVAFGAPTDEEVWVKGKCYWSVSVFADRPERLELWHIFYVRLSSKDVLIQDSEGDPISLKKWRMQNKVEGVKP
ncbi:hypothetical protein [Thiomonas sp. FB-6]|uniref:hypothetical protein n=1 Tax=Thiomonas sp. FB-6 TaxID=1158291 RepID=UPI0018CADEF7|nr:hypothetical protein [Thiomonas sp. FB-6]